MRGLLYLLAVMCGAGVAHAEEAVSVAPVTAPVTAPAVAAPVVAPTAVTTPDPAAKPALTVTLGELTAAGVLPYKFAYCVPDSAQHTKDGGNRNPPLRWSRGPQGTLSYAVIMVDPDVPTSFEDANQAGKTIPATLARQDFYHWVLADIPAAINSLPEGLDSSGVTKQGKPVGRFAYGARGVNSYGAFMGGTHGGYDGPCPPWNDELVHHYHFKVYALDVPVLGVSGPFDAAAAKQAMEGHILAEGEAVGTYTQNVNLH